MTFQEFLRAKKGIKPVQARELVEPNVAHTLEPVQDEPQEPQEYSDEGEAGDLYGL